MEQTFARLYRETLKEQKPELYQKLQTSGQLKAHVQQQASRVNVQFQSQFAALLKQHPGPQEDTIARSQHLSVLASQAREVVVSELLEPLADPAEPGQPPSLSDHQSG
jgi:Transposon-encoded protein TnpV